MEPHIIARADQILAEHAADEQARQAPPDVSADWAAMEAAIYAVLTAGLFGEQYALRQS